MERISAALNSALFAAETLSSASKDAASYIKSAQQTVLLSEQTRDGGDDRHADELLAGAESLLRGGPSSVLGRAALALSGDNCHRASLSSGLDRWFAIRAEASERAELAGARAAGPETAAGVRAAAHAAALLYVRANGEFAGAEAELEFALISAFRSARRQAAAAAPLASAPRSARRSRSPRAARSSRG